MYDRALSSRPRFASALVNKALANARLGRLEKAYFLLLRAREAEPGHSSALYNLTLRARQRNELDQALAYSLEGLEAEPWDPRLLGARADVLFDLGRFAEAESAYRQALEVGPDSADLRAARGLTLVRMGETEAGVAELERVLEEAPGHELAAGVLESLRNSEF